MEHMEEIHDDYYNVLGVPKMASTNAIKQQYRKMTLEFHPDRNKAINTNARMKKINNAYEVLSDPQKKQSYDAVERARCHSQSDNSSQNREQQTTTDESTQQATSSEKESIDWDEVLICFKKLLLEFSKFFQAYTNANNSRTDGSYNQK